MPARNDSRRALIAELHAQGLNDVQIGSRLGVSKFTICLTRKAMGLPALTRGGHKQLVSDADLIAWDAAGMSRKEMSERSGAARNTITKRLWEIKNRNRPPVAKDWFDEPEPAIVGDELFLSAFKSARVALPTNSRCAETSNRDGRIIGLPVPAFTVSSIYGA